MRASAATTGSALAAQAVATPEEPFMFFRGPRGQFTWWSWKRADEIVRGAAAVSAEGDEPAAERFLRGILALGAADGRAAEDLLSLLPKPPGRQIWLTSDALDRPVEKALAVVAVRGGWAVVLDPGPSIHPRTLAWARPTVVGGTVASLATLFDGFAALAPRWLRRTWLTRRLRRLSVVVVESGGDEEALDARLARLGASASVLSYPSSGW